MTEPPSWQPIRITVKSLFEALRILLAGPDEAAKAREVVISNLRSPNFATVPPLPADWGSRLSGDDLLILAGDGSKLDLTQIFILPRYQISDPAWSIDERRIAQAFYFALSTTPEQQAIVCLAGELKPDDSVARGAYKAKYMKKFKISGNVFDNTVWPAARERAGLPRKREPGRPKGSSKPPKRPSK
jgi:hypothetical protein